MNTDTLKKAVLGVVAIVALGACGSGTDAISDRKSTRLNSSHRT